MASRGRRDLVAVGWWGKVKTATQMLALFLLLLSGAPAPAASIAEPALQKAGIGLLYTAAALTAASAVPYCRTAWPVLSREEKSE